MARAWGNSGRRSDAGCKESTAARIMLGVFGRMKTHQEYALTGKQSGCGGGLESERIMRCPGAAEGRGCVPECRHTADNVVRGWR